MKEIAPQLTKTYKKNQHKSIRDSVIRRYAILIMSVILTIFSVFSLFSLADIRPTGSIFQYTGTYYHLGFMLFIIFNIILALVFKNIQFLLLALIYLIIWIILMSPYVIFFSDKMWTNIYINYPVSPGYGGKDQSLKRLIASNDGATCGNTGIDQGAVAVPISELCTFVRRSWRGISQACSVEIIYIRKESSNFPDAESIFTSIISPEITHQDDRYFYYYIPSAAGVLMYKSCYLISTP